MSAFDGADWTCESEIINAVTRADFDIFRCTGKRANVVYLGSAEYVAVRKHAGRSSLDLCHFCDDKMTPLLCGLRIVRVNEPRYFAVGL